MTTYGRCHMTRFADGTIRIDHADPRIWIDAALLYDIAHDRIPHATLTYAERPLTDSWPGSWLRRNPLGAVLRIEGVNRTVIYRILEWNVMPDRFLAEWPD